jgi:polyhydroxybutyrate depolymerase
MHANPHDHPPEPARPAHVARVLVAILVVVTAAACGGRGRRSADPEPPATTDATTAGTGRESGTAAPPVDAVGAVSHGTLTVDGRDRTYRLYVPADLPDGPVPLFVALHGGTGWGDQFAGTNQIEGWAEANGFIVAHPDGIEQGGEGGLPGGVWNGGVCCGDAAREDVDDVAFVAALIDHIAQDHEIDPHRTYAVGHSNGGIMSYRLACELADRIAGIGVVAGTLGVDDCSPARPVSVIHVHGTADQSVPIGGGAGPRSVSGVDFPPPRDGFDTLAAADGCPAPDSETDGDVTTARRAPCDEGTAATFVTINGAEHQWPGAPADARTRPNAGQSYAGYDATGELVRFLLAHPRD